MFQNEQVEAYIKKDSVSERRWGLVDLGKDSKHGSHRKDEQGII